MTIFGSRMLTGGMLAIIGLITVKVLTAIFGAVWGLLSFLLFTVLPIALFAFLAWKLLKAITRDRKKPAYE